MTRHDHARKTKIRARMAETGEPYMSAARAVDGDPATITTATQTPDLDAYCGQCATPVAAGTGWLWVDESVAFRLYGEALERIRTDQHDLTPGSSWLPKIRPVERWHVVHSACDQDPTGPGYAIEVERVLTWPRLVAFTAHLEEKPWLPYTNWRAVLRDAVSNAPDAILRARRLDPGVTAFTQIHN